MDFYELCKEAQKKFSQEAGRPVEPRFMVLSDGAGKVFFTGADDMSLKQRSDLLYQAWLVMTNANAREQNAMKNAPLVDLSKFKKLD